LDRLARIELDDPVQDFDPPSKQNPPVVVRASRRLDNLCLESPCHSIRHGVPLDGRHRRRSKSVSSFTPRIYRPFSTPVGHRPLRNDLEGDLGSEYDEACFAQNGCSSNGKKSDSDSDKSDMDEKRRAEEKVFLEDLNLVEERFLNDLALFGAHYSESGRSGDASDSVGLSTDKGAKFLIGGSEHCAAADDEVVFDENNSNVDLFDDCCSDSDSSATSDSDSLCEYLPLNERLKVANLRKQPSMLIKQTYETVDAQHSVNPSSNMTSKINISNVFSTNVMDNNTKSLQCDGHRSEAFKTPVCSIDEKSHRRCDALTPWGKTNIGTFEIETSMLDDLMDHSSNAPGLARDMKFYLSRDQFDSTIDSLSGDDIVHEDVCVTDGIKQSYSNSGVTNGKQSDSHSKLTVGEKVSNSREFDLYDIQTPVRSSLLITAPSSVFVDREAMDRHHKELLNTQNSSVAVTPRVLSLSERLALNLGGRKALTNGNTMDNLVAMLK